MMDRLCLFAITFFILSSFLCSTLNGAVDYPYSSGQVIFVQSPYNSSLYTNYNYNQNYAAPQRLPSYTTNQAVFVQQPYATTQQTVTSYPSTYLDGLPKTESRYMTPAAYTTTVVPAYPYANVTGYAASPYPTTSQNVDYRYPYKGQDNTAVYTYPYTSTEQIGVYPPPTIERPPAALAGTVYSGRGGLVQQNAPAYSGNAYPVAPSATYNAYPVSTVTQYPYPITTSAIPQTQIQPVQPAPVQPIQPIYVQPVQPIPVQPLTERR